MARSILRLPLQTQTSPGAACGDGTASGPAFGRQRSLGVLVRLPCPEVAAWSVSRQPGAASDKVAGRPSTRRPGAPGALQTHVVQRVRPLPPSSRLPCRVVPWGGAFAAPRQALLGLSFLGSFPGQLVLWPHCLWLPLGRMWLHRLPSGSGPVENCAPAFALPSEPPTVSWHREGVCKLP